MNDFRQTLFRFRSYNPLPFLLAMIVFAQPTLSTLVVGGAVALMGEAMRFWGVAYAGPLTRVTGSVGAPELITSGPFSHVRNPLYVGNILLYVGFGIMANALTPWLVTATAVYFVIQYAAIVSLEEEFLQKEFGSGFEEYRKSVPRFVPLISSFREVRKEHQRPDWPGARRSERRTFQAMAIVGAVVVARWIWS
ncbi:MAG: isoprenylcysteine carboxylmethyltransferase family protein [Bacteroidota bacterium]